MRRSHLKALKNTQSNLKNGRKRRRHLVHLTLRAAVPYLTVWTALSRTSRQNGTLVLLPAQTASHAADSGGGAARRRGAAWDGLREVDGSPLHTSTRITGHAA